MKEDKKEKTWPSDIDKETAKYLPDEAAADKVREALADYAHKQWIGLMKYVLSDCACMPDGGRNMSSSLVDKWLRLINTKYKDLSEEEKGIYGREADNMLKVITSQMITDEKCE